jgi:hypothetical protein
MDSRRPRRFKNKQMIIALLLLTGCILLRLSEKTSRYDRFLSMGPIRTSWKPRKYGDSLRSLSQYLGNGQCEWLPPDRLSETQTMNTTTLLASYPGSGKRLTWRILEALTGQSNAMYQMNFLVTLN